MTMRLTYGMGLAKLNLSKLFTIELTEAWLREFGDRPVTAEDLLNSGDTAYYLLRAAGVHDIKFGRSGQEVRRMKVWFNHFLKNSLPTRDGRNDSQLIMVGTDEDGLTTWTIRVRHGANESFRQIVPPQERAFG